MEYRKATIQDVNILVQLRIQQLMEEGNLADSYIDKELFKFFYRSLLEETLVQWVVIDNDNIVATGGVCFYQYPPTFSNPSGKIAYITNMCTHPDYRKQGIASILLEKVMAEAQNQECTMLRLHASKDSMRLYQKFGFEHTDGFLVKAHSDFPS